MDIQTTPALAYYFEHDGNPLAPVIAITEQQARTQLVEQHQWCNAPYDAKLLHTEKVEGSRMTVQVHHHINGQRYFTAFGKLNKEIAMDVQLNLGYHPAGYGFSSFTYDEYKDISTWSCASSCD